MTARERFAKNLKALRANSGLTQREAASKMLFKRSSYSSYENGDSEPSLGGLIDIARFYCVSLDTLLLREVAFYKEGLFIKQEKNHAPHHSSIGAEHVA